MAKSIAEIRSLAKKRTRKAIQVLVGIMLCETAPAAARVAAAGALLDRGWGKAPKAIRAAVEQRYADEPVFW